MNINFPYQIQNDSSDEEHPRNRRRSKNDNDGRTYKCDTCSKAYLSYPALYTHIKTKHDSNSNNKCPKGRGRPKKDNSSPENTMRMLYNPLSFDFFKHPERTGETNQESLPELFDFLFKRIFIEIRNTNEHTIKRIRAYNSKDEYNFFKVTNDAFTLYNNNLKESLTNACTIEGIVLNNAVVNNYNCTLDENSKCDDIFAFYLFKVGKNANINFFTIVLKFVILFRECLNYVYKDIVKNKFTQSERNFIPEYSEDFPAEDVPDISNEFILDFLQTDQHLMDFSKDEAIDFTQNLCQWLYDNNFSCSKLSLINNS